MGDGVNPYEIVLASDGPHKEIATNGTKVGKRRKHRLAGGVRDKLTMAEMKARMSALWKEGDTYPEIAQKVSDEFGLVGDARISSNGIAYHIKHQLEYWRTMGLLHIDERQAMILAKYEQLEMIATEAYFTSCQGKTTTHHQKQTERARSKDREAILLEQIRAERERRQENQRGTQPTFDPIYNEEELKDSLAIVQQKISKYTRKEENLAGDPKWVAILIDINDKRAKLWGLHSRKGPDSDEAERARLTDQERDERLAAVLSAAASRKQQQGDTNLAPPAPLGGWKEEDDVPTEPIQVNAELVDPDEELGDEVIPEEFQFDFTEEDNVNENEW